MGENIFVLLKSEQKFTCEQKAAAAPGMVWKCLLLSACGCVLQPHCAVLSPPLRGRAVPGIKELCALFWGTRAVIVCLCSRYLWRSLPCSQAPQPTLSFPPAEELLWAGNRGRRLWQPCTTEDWESCPFPHPTLQNFYSNALPFFLSLFSFLFSPFLPAFHSCLFSFSCCCCSFSFSPPITPAHCVSLLFFLLPAHFPLFLSQPFCFCSLIISFLPVLSSVLHSHPSTRSLPLIILLFFAAVSFNAFFDTAYSLMIIRRSGDAGAMNFTNPALRASVHNHSSCSTGAES